MRTAARGIALCAILLSVIPGLAFGFQPTSKPRLSQEEIDKIYRDAANKSRSEQERDARAWKQPNLPPITQVELESLVAGQNKTYPKTSRDGMRIDRAVAGPKLLTFYKTAVNHTADDFEINPSNAASYRPAFVRDTCGNVGIRNLLDSGISVRNVVRDTNGKLVYEFTVHPADCAR
jgi:hypothetical protein